MSFLPKPKYEHLLAEPRSSVNPHNNSSAAAASSSSAAAAGPARPAGWQPPAYGTRVGRFVPRTLEDFGDGGAFPEIHVLQYPLNIGRKDKKSGGAGAVVPLKVDETGKVKFDVILRQGMRAGQKVFSNFSDLVERNESEDSLARPSAEEEQKLAEKTRAALGVIVSKKLNAAQPTHVEKEDKAAVFIRYTPAQQGEQFNSGAQQRIIRVQEMPVDPLEPPKFKHKKVPGGPGSPPVPVMHSPPRKVTVADQQAWRIPPSVSNWKNIKGYTISLDKRLASDGRGLQEVQINDKFAKLSESLFIAERAARKEIEHRTNVMKKSATKAKELKEIELRTLASQARAENAANAKTIRSGGGGGGEPEDDDAAAGGGGGGGGGSDDEASRDSSRRSAAAAAAKPRRPEGEDDGEADRDALDDREALRRDRVRELRREQRLEAKKVEKGRGMANKERDVSEKIALGMNVPKSRESQFDARLFNQAEGLQAGFNSEEAYDVYDKALFKGSSANALYKPTKSGADDDAAGDQVVNAILESNTSTAKFKGDREFKGTERAHGAHAARTKPVEFQKDDTDPFNLGELLSTSAQTKGKGNALDSIGKRGQMAASGGAASSRQADEDNVSSHHRRKGIDFDESSSSASSSSGGRSRDADTEGDDRGKKRRR